MSVALSQGIKQVHQTTRYVSKWLAALCLLFVTACSQTFERQTCVTLAAEVIYCLAPLPVNGVWLGDALHTATQTDIAPTQDIQRDSTSLSMGQKVRIQAAGKHHELLSQVELDASQLTIVGLAPLGQALFTLIYDGHTLSSEQSMLLTSEFKAEYLLALMQLIYWPPAQITPYLDGAVISTQMHARGCTVAMCRTINVSPKATQQASVVNIQYSDENPWKADVTLTIPKANLTLQISPIY